MRGPVTTEFPDFDDDLQAIAARLGEGWYDSSWHNDSCPRLENDALQLALFVDYVDPARREYPELARFQIIDLNSDHHDQLLNTNELSYVQEFLSRRSAAS